MTPAARWIDRRKATAAAVRHPMPWERGARRELFIARRKLREAGLREDEVIRTLPRSA